MCLILEIPHDADPLSVEEFDDVWQRNAEGLVAIDTRTGEVLCRTQDADQARATVVGQRSIVIHWRHATSGPRDLERVHGWRVGSGYLLHNGILPGWVVPGESDTSALALALRAASLDVADHDRIAPLLDGVAGSSVIVIVPATGGAPRWYGSVRAVNQWRGRTYSNGYAWDATIHGKPPPPVKARPTRRRDRDLLPLRAADGSWLWDGDDFFPALPTTVAPIVPTEPLPDDDPCSPNFRRR